MNFDVLNVGFEHKPRQEKYSIVVIIASSHGLVFSKIVERISATNRVFGAT